MFAIPNAKRVRRDELDSPSSSRATSPNIDILEKLRASTQFEFETTTATLSTQDAPAQEEEEEELAFNLFAPVSKPVNGEVSTPAPTQTIRLRSPTPLEAQDPGFIVAHRDQSYYFTGTLTPEKEAQYAAAAVTGEMIAAWSKMPCPGCSYSWKVINIPASAARKAIDASNAAEMEFLPEEARDKRKARLGKKARIKKRIKAEKARVKKAEAEKGKEEKERLEREKKARRNREKKFKKRARDKAKKAAGQTGDAVEGSEVGDGEGSDDGSGSDSE